MGRKKPELRIGTSGYQYDHWEVVFYPKEIAKNQWFRYYAETFDTVEINNTFYRLPSEHAVDDWREQAPRGFVYALKFSRYGSHLKKLKDPKDPIRRFLKVADRLGNFLGPILVQLPPNWRVNTERLAQFLDTAPSDHRWAFEFRDRSWLCEEVYAILQKHRAALCIHDLIPDHPRPQTAAWVYMRFHGNRNHGGNYTLQRLISEAEDIRRYQAGDLDVFAYFNNDVHGYAIQNAKDLRRFVLQGGSSF